MLSMVLCISLVVLCYSLLLCVLALFSVSISTLIAPFRQQHIEHLARYPEPDLVVVVRW